MDHFVVHQALTYIMGCNFMQLFQPFRKYTITLASLSSLTSLCHHPPYG